MSTALTSSVPFGAQFIRQGGLLVSNSQYASDLSQLRFTFEVFNSDLETPNTAVIRVYNLSPQTVTKVITEYTSVVLQAGYQNAPFGIIFQGDIKLFRQGKESNVDSYLEIQAADWDQGYNFGLVNRTIQKLSSPPQRLSAAVAALGAQTDPQAAANISLGGILPRGKVMFGMARASMRELANSANARWSIQRGFVTCIQDDTYLPGSVFDLNSLTGLVGIPEVTNNGITATCLLNPLIRIGSLIHINNGDITGVELEKNALALSSFSEASDISNFLYAAKAVDGFYRVLVAEHEGDTRGEPWYTHLVCVTAQGGAVLPFG